LVSGWKKRKNSTSKGFKITGVGHGEEPGHAVRADAVVELVLELGAVNRLPARAVAALDATDTNDMKEVQ
jgi:hypothetical protein